MRHPSRGRGSSRNITRAPPNMPRPPREGKRRDSGDDGQKGRDSLSESKQRDVKEEKTGGDSVSPKKKKVRKKSFKRSLSITVDDSNAEEISSVMASPENSIAIIEEKDGSEGTNAAYSAAEGKFNSDVRYTDAAKISVEGFEIGESGISVANATDTVPENMKQNLLMLSTLGQGASGVVYKAIHVPTMRLVAVKSIPVFDASKRHHMVKELKALYANLVPIDHGTHGTPGAMHASGVAPCPFIVSFFDAYINPSEGNLAMVQEYMDGGSLQDIIDTGGCSSEGVLAQISYRICKGLEFIHHHHSIHRDIKPSNLLINHRGEVKISDFGIVRELEHTQAMASTFVGTLTYMSPERISGESYRANSDVWSFGLSIMSVALGSYPLATKGGYWGILDSVKEGPVPTLPEDEFSEIFQHFIDQCLQKNPDDRPDVDELLDHPFLDSYKESIGDGAAAATSGSADGEGSETARGELDDICDRIMDYQAPDLERIEPHKLRTLAGQLGLSLDVVSLRFEQARRAKKEELRAHGLRSAHK